MGTATLEVSNNFPNTLALESIQSYTRLNFWFS